MNMDMIQKCNISDYAGLWTCISDKLRIRRGEYPYCEFMFRADGDKIQLRLREYIRSRGLGQATASNGQPVDRTAPCVGLQGIRCVVPDSS